MSERVDCPCCATTISVEEWDRKVTCPECWAELTIGHDEDTYPPTPYVRFVMTADGKRG